MRKWKAVAALAFSLALLMMVAVLAEHRRADAATKSLTALDYIEIQQLVNRYGQAIDTCSNNGNDYADLYAPDGVFIDKFSDEGFQKGGLVRAKGHDMLAEIVWGGSRGCKDMPWNGWSHLMVDHVITPSPEGATGRCYLIMLDARGPNTVQRDGGYEDVYVKTAAGWRFKSRTHVRTRAWHAAVLQSPDLK
jgi:hypothetical protein